MKRMRKLEKAKDEWGKARYDEAKNLLIDVAEGKDKDAGEACYWLGTCYQIGALTVILDYNTGATYIKKAAELGHTMAMYRCSVVAGHIIELDEWYKKAFENGDDYTKARCYRVGRNGVDSDTKKAVYHLKRAAKQGDMEAQYDLASCYTYGSDGVKRNESRAFEWYLKSAQQGYPPAQIMICYSYLCGVETQKNTFTAFKWYEKYNRQLPRVTYPTLDKRFEQFVERENTRRAIYCFISIHKHCHTVIGTLPHYPIKLIIIELWKTRHDPLWNFGINEIIK